MSERESPSLGEPITVTDLTKHGAELVLKYVNRNGNNRSKNGLELNGVEITFGTIDRTIQYNTIPQSTSENTGRANEVVVYVAPDLDIPETDLSIIGRALEKVNHALATREQKSDVSTIPNLSDADVEHLESLISRYHTQLSRFIGTFVKDADTTNDVLQQVYIQLYLSFPTLHTNTSLRGWLFQVARNRSLDELRRKKLIHFSELEAVEEDEDQPSILETLADKEQLPDEELIERETQATLQAAINSLPLKLRTVVQLRYEDGLTLPEIATQLNMPVASVKTRYQRAKSILRMLLASDTS